jgi:hypothetical protein
MAINNDCLLTSDATKRTKDKGNAANWKTYSLVKEPAKALSVDECAKRCDEDSSCSAFEYGNGKDLSKKGDCTIKKVSTDKFTA